MFRHRQWTHLVGQPLRSRTRISNVELCMSGGCAGILMEAAPLFKYAYIEGRYLTFQIYRGIITRLLKRIERRDTIFQICWMKHHYFSSISEDSIPLLKYIQDATQFLKYIDEYDTIFQICRRLIHHFSSILNDARLFSKYFEGINTTFQIYWRTRHRILFSIQCGNWLVRVTSGFASRFLLNSFRHLKLPLICKCNRRVLLNAIKITRHSSNPLPLD
jgi:hypothetical protein